MLIMGVDEKIFKPLEDKKMPIMEHLHELHEVPVHVTLVAEGHGGWLVVGALAQAHTGAELVHAVAIANLKDEFADVVSTDEVIEALR